MTLILGHLSFRLCAASLIAREPGLKWAIKDILALNRPALLCWTGAPITTSNRKRSGDKQRKKVSGKHFADSSGSFFDSFANFSWHNDKFNLNLSKRFVFSQKSRTSRMREWRRLKEEQQLLCFSPSRMSNIGVFDRLQCLKQVPISFVWSSTAFMREFWCSAKRVFNEKFFSSRFGN